MIRLDDTSRCPIAAACAMCAGTTGLAVATVETPVGVYCATLCGQCAEAERTVRPPSWGAAIDLVTAHCGHLGVDVDRMAALMDAERANDVGGW
jgi:hypothetical protein